MARNRDTWLRAAIRGGPVVEARMIANYLDIKIQAIAPGFSSITVRAQMGNDRKPYLKFSVPAESSDEILQVLSRTLESVIDKKFIMTEQEVLEAGARARLEYGIYVRSEDTLAILNQINRNDPDIFARAFEAYKAQAGQQATRASADGTDWPLRITAGASAQTEDHPPRR